MSSFSHLSASHNSNNGNPKKHWRAPAWCDSTIWEAMVARIKYLLDIRFSPGRERARSDLSLYLPVPSPWTCCWRVQVPLRVPLGSAFSRVVWLLFLPVLSTHLIGRGPV